MNRRRLTLMVLSLFWMSASAAANAAEDIPLSKVRLPPGFEISLFAKVPNARSMTLSPNRTLFVGTRAAGNVYAIATRGEANQNKKPVVIARGLNMPNGVAFRDGAL